MRDLIFESKNNTRALIYALHYNYINNQKRHIKLITVIYWKSIVSLVGNKKKIEDTVVLELKKFTIGRQGWRWEKIS